MKDVATHARVIARGGLRSLPLFLVLILAAAVSTATQSNTYYVATSGNDSSSGTMGAPWLTLGHAVTQLHAGDTLLIRGGTYTGSANVLDSTLITLASGTSSSPITVSAYPGSLAASTVPGPRPGAEVVTIQTPNGSHTIRFATTAVTWWTFQDLIIDNVNELSTPGNPDTEPDTIFFKDGSSYNTLLHLEVKNGIRTGVVTSGDVISVADHISVLYCHIHDHGLASYEGQAGYGIYFGTGNNLVEGDDIHDNHGWGIQATGNPGIDTSHSIYRSNTIHHNYIKNPGSGPGGTTGGGINISGAGPGLADGNLVYNNLIYRNGHGSGGDANVLPGSGALGILIYNESSNMGVYQNTVYGNNGDGIAMQYYASPAPLVENNISFGNAGTQIVDYMGGTGTPTIGYNLATDPGLANVSANDYHLTVGCVTAIGQGATLTAVVDDFAGVTRVGHPYDVGAYEYLAPGGPVAPEAPAALAVTLVTS